MAGQGTICGYLNRLLTVDLSTGCWEVMPLSPEYVRGYLGGRGLGARYLLDLLPAGVDPLAPDNVAILMCGPFTATDVYSCHKYEWVTKSPLTGTYLCSNCGGGLGVSLRRAGFDGLVITGAARRPVYLHIGEQGLAVCDASGIWGRSVSQTQELLGAALGAGVAVGCIGPAGEPPGQVRFAGFFDGQRSAGRGGLGAVLGSKQLKAIAVAPGGASVPVHDPGELQGLLPGMAQVLKRDRITGEALPEVGSLLWIDALALHGLLPARNYQTALTYAEIRGRLDSDTFRTRHTEQPAGNGPDSVHCHRCLLRSAKVCTPESGGLRGRQVRGPEFQSAWALGVNCGVMEYQPIISAYAACNEYGLDAVSLGGAVGFAMECGQRGLLDLERVARDYEGLRLEWGNCEGVVRLVGIVAERQGWLGELLGAGVRAAAEQIPGSEAFALHVKGMELPGYDPRGSWGMGLAYATSCRGACHLKGWTADAENGGSGAPPDAAQGKAAMVVAAEDSRAVVDSLLVCAFASRALTDEWIARLVRAVMGPGFAEEELAAYGARICDLERALAQREGVSWRDDRLPDRILQEPVCGGEHDGARIGRGNFEWMRSEYYALRGWGREGVAPSPADRGLPAPAGAA